MDDETLRNIFPSEIWLQIVESEPHNISKAYHSSPFFGKLILILQCKIQLLSSAVLPIVLTNLPADEATTKILLNSRLVCRSWSKIVTRYVQEKMKLFTETSKVEAEFPWYLDPFCVTFTGSIDSVTSYLKHFELTHLNQYANPFVSRHVKLRIFCLGEIATPYFSELEKLLAKCGHHVRYFHLSAMPSDASEYFSRFRAILDQLPNLKGITFSLMAFRNMRNRGMQRERVPAFPNYPKLECLKVGGNTSVCLLDTLLTNNRHIKMLVRDCWEYEQDELHCEPMPNLEHLKLGCYGIDDLETLENLNHTWPLKKLEINFRCIGSYLVSWLKMEKGFKVLEEKFGDTLQNLHIGLPFMKHLAPSPCTLNLPHLTSLSLCMHTAYLLDFVLPLKNNLINLNVTIETKRPKGMKENDIQFYGVSNNLLHSNIWSLFPKLQTVRFLCLEEEVFKKTYRRSEII